MKPSEQHFCTFQQGEKATLIKIYLIIWGLSLTLTAAMSNAGRSQINPLNACLQEMKP